ncbi:gluconate 2-dehydrogenase subunit 3 family protein [Thalassomonas sp. RHCl1]|uniref:gluconate 2-dehydrogenase subunit 3 family protein n=1 Tax=Thalassomonas sp. RHCl1 TaxID=2995320 RepID=UPI00248ACC28|nr:gluconate 2-dehydrogenase subunit 3 family protein [Thalassomonas sp. RHCl1]
MVNIRSFFDVNYQTPLWFKEKHAQIKISRRALLKSAAGASAIAALPAKSWIPAPEAELIQALKTDPWLTLNAVLDHLLPASDSGPGARDIQALDYLYNVVTKQPTEQDEIEFIFKGVGWLNDFSNSQSGKPFVTLEQAEKEKLLRAISNSRAGENWLNTLLNYIFEAMLSPPVYGGNPDGIGWKWLEHKPGFPLPNKGKRYYELPGQKGIAVKVVAAKGSKKA